eukprot:gene7057-7271_t
MEAPLAASGPATSLEDDVSEGSSVEFEVEDVELSAAGGLTDAIGSYDAFIDAEEGSSTTSSEVEQGSGGGEGGDVSSTAADYDGTGGGGVGGGDGQCEQHQVCADVLTAAMDHAAAVAADECNRFVVREGGDGVDGVDGKEAVSAVASWRPPEAANQMLGMAAGDAASAHRSSAEDERTGSSSQWPVSYPVVIPEAEQTDLEGVPSPAAATAAGGQAVLGLGGSASPVSGDRAQLYSLSGLEAGEAWMAEDLEVGSTTSETAAAGAADVGLAAEAAAVAGGQASAAASGQKQEEEEHEEEEEEEEELLQQQSGADASRQQQQETPEQPTAQRQQQVQPSAQQSPQQQEDGGRGQRQELGEEEQLLDFAMPASARSSAPARAEAEDEFSVVDELPEQHQAQEPLTLKGYLDIEHALAAAAAAPLPDEQHILNKLLYDAGNQALMQQYEAAHRVEVHPYSEAAAAAGPPLVRSLPPAGQLAAVVSKAVVGWSRARVREDNGGVERLLAEDAQEADKAWAKIDAEVAGVALEVAEAVWDGLLQDTAHLLMGLQGMAG